MVQKGDNMGETVSAAAGNDDAERRTVLKGLFENVGDLIQVTEAQGHANTALQDLPQEVIEAQYRLRHPADETQA